jgi:hypothetical protein
MDLSLMELIARRVRRPLQINPFAKSGERPAARLIEGLSFPHDGFETVGQKGTDRPPLLGRHDSRLAPADPGPEQLAIVSNKRSTSAISGARASAAAAA